MVRRSSLSWQIGWVQSFLAEFRFCLVLLACRFRFGFVGRINMNEVMIVF